MAAYNLTISVLIANNTLTKMKVSWFASALLAAFANGIALEADAEFGAMGGMGGMGGMPGVDPMIAAQVSAL